MKNKKEINVFLRTSSLIVLFLSLSLNIYSANTSSKAFPKSDLSNEFNTAIQDLTRSSLNVSIVNLTNNLSIELEEDDDDDTKNHSLNHSFCTQVISNNLDLVSGNFYLNSFLFYKKTPRFILYKNFRDFLS